MIVSTFMLSFFGPESQTRAVGRRLVTPLKFVMTVDRLENGDFVRQLCRVPKLLFPVTTTLEDETFCCTPAQHPRPSKAVSHTHMPCTSPTHPTSI